MSEQNELKVRRVLELVRALTNYINDVIGHGPKKLDYFALLERDLGPLSLPLIWRIIDMENNRRRVGFFARQRRNPRKQRS